MRTDTYASAAVALALASQSLGSAGGTGTPVAVTTGGTCAWSATANVSWLRITSASTGNGTVTFTVDSHTGAARSGTLTIAGQTFTLSQMPPCAYSLSPTSRSFSDDGGSGTTAVTAAAGYAWTAVSTDSWIRVTAGASGNGNGTVSFTGSANSGNRRTGTIRIGTATLSVIQED